MINRTGIHDFDRIAGPLSACSPLPLMVLALTVNSLMKGP